MSASRIEKYNRCPYSFFMSYGIKAERKQLSNTDVGTFAYID